MQRTTVRLPDDLLDAAKRTARRTSRSLTQLLEDALRAELSGRPSPSTVSEPTPIYRVSAMQAATVDEPRDITFTAEQLAEQVKELQAFLSALPDRDARAADDILRYNALGISE